MADPFERMGLPMTGVDPDPVFAARLRTRVARALDQPRGATMPQTVAAPAPAVTHAAVTPYLVVLGAQRAIEWYTRAFGARMIGDPVIMPNGTIGHADLDLGGAHLMLAEAGPPGQANVEAPDPDRGVPVTLHLSVGDVDAAFDRAVSVGARPERPVTTYEYGRAGVLRDPFGHRWMVMTPAPSGPRHGDAGYVSLWVPDAVRATAFFAEVLGWRYGPASGPGGRQVQGLSLHHGLWSSAAAHTLFCCYAVDSIAEALNRIRAAGGTAERPTSEPYGLGAMCTDDQGVPFAVFEPPRTASPGPPTEHGTGHGDLAYITMEVEDSVRTREFYGSVLGWRFTPGRIADGWQVEGVTPMTGISGGHDQATTVPMYRVDNIADAVRRVRDLGGSASDPERQPYGTTSECTDDQGTRFYLGEL
jgi:uncharacterized glyoxalase superfamily protein PhnB